MASKAITIRVNPEAAQAYEAASAEERRKFDVLLSLKLAEVTQEERSLEEVMRDISRNAQARGLTPEILQALLDE
jgi:hypothetical protein